jgi:phenylalanine-4-hydroxylase
MNRDYADSFERPFACRYNALTQSIEVLDTKDKVVRFANTIKTDVARLTAAINKII